MDIHKSSRKWPGFVKEVGIVVLGVGLALAAQQAADWLHWQDEVKAARAALRAEITAIDDFYALRVAIAPCLDRRLDKAEQAIRDIAARRKMQIPEVSTRGIGALLSDSEWQSERSAQTLTHFPRAELAAMSLFYAQVPEIVTWETREADAWWAMRVLQHADDGLTQADLAALRLNLQVARHHAWLLELNARRMLAVSDRLGLARPRIEAERVNNFCTMSGADYARYLDTKEPR